MKIRKGFVLRTILGQHIVVSNGSPDCELPKGQIILNDSSAFLWKLLIRPVTRENLVDGIMEEYDITRCMAENAVDIFVDRISSLDLLE